MISIATTFRVRPDDADGWPEIGRGVTEATRAEHLGEMRVDLS